jgi:hypothetical protein
MASNEKPDTSSVRALVTSVTELAKHLKLTNNGIYRWIKVNRIPAHHIITVANYYDVELNDLMPLTGSDLSAPPNVILKQRDTLPTLLKVKAGTITLSQASRLLEQREVGLKLILTHWGDQLQLLYDTLQELDLGLVSLDNAAKRLGVAKYTLHGIRRKYGFAPGVLKRKRPLPTLPARKARNTEAAIEVIAGTKTAVEAAKAYKMSERTIFRAIEHLTSYKLTELAHWPTVFRQALTVEITKNTPKYVESWLKFAESHSLFTRKDTKYPVSPESWQKAPLKRLLVAVLSGEYDLDAVAAMRRADPVILRSLFNSDLRSLNLTYEEVENMSVQHQGALAELHIWMLDRKRKFNV